MAILKFSAHCDRHGSYTATRIGERVAGCPQCTDERAAVQNARNAKRAAQIARRQHIARRLKNAGVPPRFARARLHQLHAPFVPALRDYVIDAANGRTLGPLILAGSVGTGKSHAAAVAVRIWIGATRNHADAHFVGAGDYCAEVRATWRRESERHEDAVVAQYAHAPFLVLDDLGAGKSADAELIQALICRRYDADLMAATIVSTNIAPAAFGDVFGERIADRLREGAVLVTATGPSRRRPSP